MSIYTKSKTTVSSLKKAKDFEVNDSSFKVGIKSGAENIIIDYLTNLYSNPPTAVCRELFTNASDASNDDLPVYIELKKEEDKDTCSFSITDYGCGMSSEELKNNYITYANSTKVSDYDSVGSFGLGSKSPMAIVPKYTVESFDGKEQNIATVARTDNGIFANIEKVEKLADHSFTRVSFGGISFNVASKMHLYIRENICRFSKQPVHFKSCLKDEVEFLECYKLSDDVSIYSNNIKKAFITYHFSKANVDECFQVLARIDNIIYKVNYLSHCDSYIVVDVEPGYFSFAPSREELPYGEEKNHITEIANKKLFESDYDFVRFITEHGIFECDTLFSYLFARNLMSNIDNLDCFYGASNEQLNKYKDIIDIDNGDYELDEDSIKFYTIRSEESCRYRFSFKDNKKLVQVSFKEFINRLKHSVNFSYTIGADGKFSTVIKDKGYLNNVTIVENTKFNRKNEVVIPSQFKVSNARKFVKSEFLKTCNKSESYNCNKFGWYFVYLKSGTKLPDIVLEYINMFCAGLKTDKLNNTHPDISSAEIIEYPTEDNTLKPTVKRISVRDRKDSIAFYSPDHTWITTTNYGDDKLVETLRSGYKYFLVDDNNAPTTSFLCLFTELYSIGIIKISDRTKMVKNYLNSLGLEELVISDALIEKMKQDVKEKFVDGEYVASFISGPGYSMHYADFSLINSDLDVTNYPLTYLAILLNNNVCCCETIAEFFKVDKNVCKAILRPCYSSYKFGRERILDNDIDKRAVIFNQLKKSINKRKAWNDSKGVLTKITIAKMYKSTISYLHCLGETTKFSGVCTNDREKLLIEILDDKINSKISSIDFSKLDSAVEDFSKMSKYISIYNSLSDNEVDSFVKSKINEKSNAVVKAFSELKI